MENNFLTKKNWLKRVWNRVGELTFVNLRLSYYNSLFFFLVCFKLLLFDFLWDFNTTFSSFTFFQGYVNKICVALLLLFPFMLFRRNVVPMVVCFLMDIFLVANLAYFRTYFTAIPLDSYGLLNNLQDFTDSVFDSLHWTDILFPLSTLFGYVLYRRKKESLPLLVTRKEWFSYGLFLVVSCGVSGLCYVLKGGILKQNEDLQNANYFMTRTPVFTLFGSLYCDYKQKTNQEDLSSSKHKIKNWFAAHSYTPAKISSEGQPNCIVILAESLESWVLEKEVEGNEITPCMNALLKKQNTVYAPHVLSQVKGGRSIDAQLLLYTGLLPIRTGSYSIKYPQNYYPSLIKAFKERYPDTRAYTMTVDKNITWNQEQIAKAFGYDSVLWKKDFIVDEKIGDRKKLGDYSFLNQCAKKLEYDDLWAKDGHTFIQCVTYSGHNPFVLPDSLKQIFFSDRIPRRMNDYMTMANYTDRAIGNFIDQLIRQGKYDNTMIVITGDHEGLASDRATLCATEIGKQIVSAEKFTPFIVLNAPMELRYNKVMGQVDMYPTLLQLLGVDDYSWKGLGYSILDETTHGGFAVSPQMEVVGTDSQTTPSSEEHRKKAWKISNKIIKQDYLREHLKD